MSPRRPPRLANWLLDRFGVERRNPPLTGDLLEEFRNGRSAAWFWRQTLVVIFKGLGRNLRVFWQTWTGILGGWGAQAVIASALWRSHFPPQLPTIIGAIAAAALSIKSARDLWRLLRRKAPADDQLSTEETAEAADEPSWVDLVAGFSISFTAPLLAYCVFALLWGMAAWIFIAIETEFLLLLMLALKPDSDAGPVKTS
jgi:hypothetical protein